MKVVIFCGGLGMRLREYADNVPKPMVPIGNRPVLWHVMKYYAHFGHKDFILCLGYRADAVKQYFLHYDECVSNDFSLSKGGKDLRLFNSDIHDWNITFAETGMHSNIGQRLKAVEKYLAGEEVFLANYADGLTDLELPKLIDFSRQHGKIATFVSAKPNLTYHVVAAGPDGVVSEITAIRDSALRINSGYFVLRQEIFKHMRDGEELVLQPFQRLINEKQLMAYEHNGFYASMDTFKDKQQLDDMYAKGDAPWVVWKSAPSQGGNAAPEPRKESAPDPAGYVASRRDG
jgi:glucose-1-phosphate cytidylyltransferase